jgi:hypothetical protein
MLLRAGPSWLPEQSKTANFKPPAFERGATYLNLYKKVKNKIVRTGVGKNILQDCVAGMTVGWGMVVSGNV